MAGFVYGVDQTMRRPQPNVRANISMAAPYYGYGLYYNPSVQNIEGVTCQYGVFNGFGVNGNVYSQPVQRQMYYCKPYGANNSSGSAAWVQVGINPYCMNGGTQNIQGDIVQRGTFNGRGMGARICGHLSVSGDIN